MVNGQIRTRLKSPRLAATAFLFSVAFAETITTYFNTKIGLWLHVLLFSVLIFVGLVERSRPLSRMWVCFSFAPMIRVISLATPLSNYRLVYWYILTGVPIFIAALVVLRYLRLPRERLALQVKWSPGQVLVGISGLALGYVEYLILRPKPLISELSLVAIVEALLILMFFTGLVEEIIFRGLMQHTAEHVLGGAGIIYIALAFTILHLGYQSLADMVFVFVVALYFGFYVRRTRSIFGVTLAHGLTNVALFLIFPFLMAGRTPQVKDIQKDVISPLMPLPKSTSTPIRPHTPTPFPPQSPTPSPTPSTPILVDDGDAGFTSLSCRWWLEEVGYGGDLHWAGTRASDPFAEAFWRPTIGTCGRYEVQVHLPERYPTTQQARYTVAHRGGVETVVVDQSAQTGWVTLGTFEITPGGESYLQLDNATGEPEEWGRIIVFDAARWTFQSSCDADSEP